MKLMIDDIDYSQFTERDSVIVRRAERMSNFLEADLYGYIGNINLSVFHQVEFYNNSGEIEFAGELLKFEKDPIGNGLYRISIQAHDYEHILTRRAAQEVTWTGYAGDYIRKIVNDWLVSGSAYSENITAGNIEKGAYLTKFTAPIMTFWGMFDAFAKTSGYTWYIDMKKALHFTQGIESKFNGKVIDLDDMSKTTSKIYDLSHTNDVTNFKTRVYVVGKDKTQLAGAVNPEVEAELKTDYFSGVVGKIINNYDVETFGQSEVVAKEELKKYGSMPLSLHFFTIDTGYSFSDLIKFRSADLGVPDYRYYTITQTIKTYQLYGHTITEVYADAVDPESVDPKTLTAQHNPKEHWTDAFNQGLNDNEIRNVENFVNDSIQKYDSTIHTNIHCEHIGTEATTLTLLIKGMMITEPIEYGCYQFTLNQALPPSPKIEICSETPDGTMRPIVKAPWLKGNNNAISMNDYGIGARIEVLHNYPTKPVGESAFFSDGSGDGDVRAKFQVAAGSRVVRMRFAFTYNTGYSLY